jgi:flagellar hook-length control protein FliK
VEIIQAKLMPQAASTGSTGASVASAPGNEAESDGFLSLMNCFMGEGIAEDPEAAPAAGQGTQATSAIPDGMLSLIAPGLFSNLIIQPQQQPASGDAPAPAGDGAADPLAALPPGQFPEQPPGQLPEQLTGEPQAPAGPSPDLPAKGLATQPGQGEPAADGNGNGDEVNLDAEVQLSEEDLTKLVAEGKAKIEAQQGRKAQQPSARADQSKAQTSSEQAAATDIPLPAAATVQVVREPAPVGLTAKPRSDADDRLTAEAADPDAKPVSAKDGAKDEAKDGDTALAVDGASGGEPADKNAGTGSGTSGQGGETNGSRQAQQHAARMEKGNERAAEQQDGANASRTSASAAGIEAESRGGAAVRAASGAADDGGKPAAAKERGAEGGPTFEEALAKVKPVHKEPEADGSLGVQAATHGPAEAEAAERTAAPHSRGGVPHSAADQVSVQLGKAVPGKNDQMVINLKPVELGSVEVKLDFGADGRVQASIMAERPETLEMLQKDHRALERALNDAGLQTDPGSLSFNLKGQGQGGNQRQFAGYNQPGAGRGKGFARMDIEGPALPDFAAPQYSASSANRSRLDIRI